MQSVPFIYFLSIADVMLSGRVLFCLDLCSPHCVVCRYFVVPPFLLNLSTVPCDPGSRFARVLMITIVPDKNL